MSENGGRAMTLVERVRELASRSVDGDLRGLALQLCDAFERSDRLHKADYDKLQGWIAGGRADAARITALEAENARLREGVSEIEKVAGHCERINLIGKTPEAKLAGTLRNILIRTRTLLERQTDD